MSKPEEIKIQAKNIDASAGEIIGILEDTSKGNVIFVDGWFGFGASAAVKAVAHRLKSTKSKFDRVVHVDCSLWKSMRALQKAVAEDLELPPSVMSVFDRQDEEDDYSGIDEGSRGVIADIRTQIFRKLVDSRFVVIFHNGNNRYIDLCESCGVPVISALSNKVLWTWHGRFRPSFLPKFQDSEKWENMELHTDIVVNYFHDDCIRDEALLEEAKEVFTYMGIPEPSMNHMIVKKCFQYAYELGYALGFGRSIFPYGYSADYGSELLVCEGIIQGEGDTSAWEVAEALQRNMHLDWLMESPNYDMRRRLQCMLPDRWVVVKHKGKLFDERVHSEATSLFMVQDVNYYGRATLLDGILQHSHSSKLRVLHLHWCTFSFESPPFLCCSQLRFLRLDSCTDIPSDKHPSHNEDMPCFQKLWVLHLMFTNWNRLLSEEMLNFMADLRELCVYGVEYWSTSDLRVRGPSLVKFHVKDSTGIIASIPNLSSSGFLKTINLDDCDQLKQVVPGTLPPSLESFTFNNNNYYDLCNISSISFRGCSQLKNVTLKGNLRKLEELDLAGTAVKILDLKESRTGNLKRLVLLGCEKLCAILWPPVYMRTTVLEVLHIDTTQTTSPGQANWEEKPQNPTAVVGPSSILAATATELCIGPHAEFRWYICTRDTRIFRSLEAIKGYIEHRNVHMEMNSSPKSVAAVGDSEVAQGIRSLYHPNNYFYAREFFFESDLQSDDGNEGAISWMWACPASPTPVAQDSYVHIQDKQQMKSGLLQRQKSNSAVLPPSFIVNKVRMLHVHDSSSITCITCPQGSYWRCLEWCRVERCPELHTVFCTDQQSKGDSFCQVLSTFWASELLKARYIWDWSTMRVFSSVHIGLLHLDYCPRVIHVLPLSESVDSLPHLDTLEIVYCGDLREVFALDPKKKEQKIIEFPKLRRIHLFELPSLQHICGNRISAPNLETVRIRGCWSLRSLPAVGGNNQKLPSVDCEKEWWDSLEWDGVEANHHPSLYEHIHSSYYKAQLPRGTVLR